MSLKRYIQEFIDALGKIFSILEYFLIFLRKQNSNKTSELVFSWRNKENVTLFTSILTLKAPITSEADLKYFFFFFSEKMSLDISCVFSLKNKK